MAKGELFLIDATAFCYRAYYALPSLSTSFGLPTNAIYGFINILNKVLKTNKPELIGVCFDVSRDTFRAKKFAEYKINRPPMPEGLSGQIPYIKEIVRAFGLVIFEKEGFEADDIIASLSGKAKKENLSVTIVSSDKDILQLVDKDVSVFSPYKDTGVLYDTKKVEERFGVTPGQIPDMIALMGDSVDNIPGVSGIGEKTASSLIKKFGCIDNLLKSSDKIEQEKLKVSIEESKDKIRLNKELAVLNKDLELGFKIDDAKVSCPNNSELARLFKFLEFKKLLKNIPREEESIVPAKEIAVLSDKEAHGLLKESRELFVYLKEETEIIFMLEGKIFRIASKDTIKNILEDKNIKKCGHDLKEIKFALAKEGIELEGLFFDTMIAAYLVNPSKSNYSLLDVSLDFLGEYLEEDRIDASRALSVVYKLKTHLEKELKEKSLDKLFLETEMPLVSVLAKMEITGVKVDIKFLKSLSVELNGKLDNIISSVYRISEEEFNINSPKQLRIVLFEKLKLPVVKKTKTGPSTDEEVLRKLSTLHELPRLILEYRQLTKLKNTYIDTLPEEVDSISGRIHASFNQTGTETGRLSSANPNLQNIPIKTEIGSLIRKAFIAKDKNYFLLSCDYSQIELRILAHLSKDETLSLAFLEDKDIHKRTAALINNIEEDKVTNDMREVAKRINFGIVYGLSSWGLSKDLDIPPEEAQSFIDAYFSRYSKVKDFIESSIEKARKDGFVTTILGRRRYLPEINSKNMAIRQLAERQAVNTPIQGSASDLIKLAMIDIQRLIDNQKLDSKMIIQVHDELIFDVAEKESGNFIDLVKHSMESVLKLDIPIRVSIKKGRNWLEMESNEDTIYGAK